jgi:hypothetical protein
MAEDEGLEPTRPKSPVFKTGALPIMLILRERNGGNLDGSIARSGRIFPVARDLIESGYVHHPEGSVLPAPPTQQEESA